MIMNKIRVFMAFIVAGLLVCSCDKDNQNMSNEQGTLRISLDASSELINVGTRADQDAAFDVGDFTLQIFKGSDSMGSWTFRDYDTNLIYPFGNYRAAAFYGDINAEGWNLPYLYGSTDFVINKTEGNEVTIVTEIANSKFTVDYTENFKSFFEEYSTVLISSLSNEISFGSDEAREAYVKPGNISFKVSVKKQGASDFVTLAVNAVEALPKHLYRMKFDVDAGSAQLIVSFTEDVEEVIIDTIDISDESLNDQAPYFVITGFESGVSFDVVSGMSAGELKAMLMSLSGIESCVMTTTSVSLLEKGWPASVDLNALTAEQKTILTNLGLKVRGFGDSSEGVAVIDFTDVVPNLAFNTTDPVTTISLVATDKNAKEASTVLIINSTNE